MAMAAPVLNMADTLVTLKVNIDGTNRRFKLPLRDLGANTLPDKVCREGHVLATWCIIIDPDLTRC